MLEVYAIFKWRLVSQLNSFYRYFPYHYHPQRIDFYLSFFTRSVSMKSFNRWANTLRSPTVGSSLLLTKRNCADEARAIFI